MRFLFYNTFSFRSTYLWFFFSSSFITRVFSWFFLEGSLCFVSFWTCWESSLRSWLGSRWRIVIHEWKRVIPDDRDFFGDEPLDIIEICFLFSITKRDSSSLCTCSTSTADAVDISFRNIRNLIVDHIFELIDIDPTRSNISRDEDTSRLGLEVCKCFLSCWLGLVPMDCLGWYAILSKDFHDFIGSTFCPSEYKYCFYTFFFENIEKEWGLIFLIDKIYLLCNDIDGRRNRCDGDFCRIYKDCTCELDNLWRHGCREKKCLFLRRKYREKFLHIVDKSHIKHTVCLIEDEYLYISKCEVSLSHEIKKPSWRRDNYIDAISKCRDLCSLSDSSEYDTWSEMSMSSIREKTLTNLDCELTSRCDYERTDSFSNLIFPIRSYFWCNLLWKSLDDRYSKCCCLSSSCLCTAKKIESTEDNRNCLFLDRSWCRISLFFECFENRSDKLEFRKLHWIDNREIEFTPVVSLFFILLQFSLYFVLFCKFPYFPILSVSSSIPSLWISTNSSCHIWP